MRGTNRKIRYLSKKFMRVESYARSDSEPDRTVHSLRLNNKASSADRPDGPVCRWLGPRL